MLTPRPSRWLTRALIVGALSGASLGACQAMGAATETVLPTASLTATPGAAATAVNAGTITLTDRGCTWDANPGSIAAGPASISVRNETQDYGVFIVHKLRPGRTFAEGTAAIAEIQDALKTGAEWPAEVSDSISEATAEAGEDAVITVAATAGTLGVVCSANTSRVGDILTVFLVGPLEVTRP